MSIEQDISKAPKRPRYAEIADALRDDIAAGTYPVGSFLPTESNLCSHFSVSRFTVREALRRLQSDGMVSRTQGAGSRVLRDAPSGVFVQNYRSMSDLTQYAEQTNLDVLNTREVILDLALAGQIGGTIGDVWFVMTGVRRLSNGEPLALVESYVPYRFAAIAPDLARGAGPIYAGLANAAGEPVQDVEQETQALPAPAHVANSLGLADGAPSLRILRRYSSRSGTLIASFNWHLGGDRYVHRTRIGLSED